MARIASIVVFVVFAFSLSYCLPVKTVEVGDLPDHIVKKNDLDMIVPSDKHVIVKRSPSVGIFHGEKCPIHYFRAPNGQCVPENDIPDPEYPEEEDE